MERIIMEHGGLPEEQAMVVVQIAKHQNLLFGGTEDFLVTREFHKISTAEDKLALLDCLFSVAAAEGLIATAEDAVIRQIAAELSLTHQDFIAVRSRYRDHLAVLQEGEPPQGWSCPPPALFRRNKTPSHTYSLKKGERSALSAEVRSRYC